MASMKFPRVMTKGLLAGVHVKDHAEYGRLLKAAKKDAGIRGSLYKRNTHGRKASVPSGSYRLEVNVGSMHMTIEGHVTDESQVVNTLLDALAKLPLQDR